MNDPEVPAKPMKTYRYLITLVRSADQPGPGILNYLKEDLHNLYESYGDIWTVEELTADDLIVKLD